MKAGRTQLRLVDILYANFQAQISLYNFQLFYLPRPCLNEERGVSLAVDCVFQLHKTEPPEDGFLVFLPGVDEILAAVRMTTEKSKASGLKMIVLPLYSSLPTTKQNLIYAVNSVSFFCLEIDLREKCANIDYFSN